jgi:hypothetical protein
VPAVAWRLWLAAGAVGLPMAWAAFHYLRAADGPTPGRAFVGLAVAMAALSALVLRAIWPQLRGLNNTQRAGWAVAAWLVGAFLVVVIPLPLPAGSVVPPSGGAWLRLASVYFGAALGLGLLVLWGGLWIVRRSLPPHRPQPVGRWDWLPYATLCAAVWGLVLLAFWPGLMSSDSVEQWSQIVRGEYNDISPAIHTLTMWLITRLWFSPGAVALVQILALAAVIGWGLALLKSYGVPAWATWAACVLSVFSLVNALMIITLWKDILYSVVALAFTLLLLMLVRGGGQWLTRRPFLAALTVAAALMALYRHNGVPVVLVTLVAAMLSYRRWWRPLAVVLVGAAAVWLLVRGPLYSSLRVRTPPDWYAWQPILSQVASYVQDGALETQPPLDEASVDLLNAYHPLADGWQAYDCRFPFEFVVGEQTNREAINGNTGQLLDLYVQLVSHDPDFAARALIYCNSVVWQITQPVGANVITIPLGRGNAGELITVIPYPNSFGIGPRYQLPQLAEWLAGQYFLSMDSRVIWRVWRPAIYSYLLLAAVVLAALRLKEWRYGLLALPALLTTLPYLLLSISPDFRFHYTSYLVGLFLCIPLQFLPPAAAAATLEGAVPDSVDRALDRTPSEVEIAEPLAA